MPDDTFRSDHDDAAWEALLQQLQQHGRQLPPPFFYARVRRRLLAKTRRGTLTLPMWLRRPAYVAVLAALVLAVSGDSSAAAPGGAAHLPLLHQKR